MYYVEICLLLSSDCVVSHWIDVPLLAAQHGGLGRGPWCPEDVGAGLQREDTYVYKWLIHTAEQQKLTQHCKAVPLYFKINFKNKINYTNKVNNQLHKLLEWTKGEGIRRNQKRKKSHIFLSGREKQEV